MTYQFDRIGNAARILSDDSTYKKRVSGIAVTIDTENNILRIRFGNDESLTIPKEQVGNINGSPPPALLDDIADSLAQNVFFLAVAGSSGTLKIGNWQFVDDPSGLLIQHKENGAYVTKQTITP